ncbi:hypothetical protein [Marinigracilibium pacificum]|uniref:Viral A-type inclusion protein n=1 Tax=Marinigracilibium pacificum TaxID=2729599 RepID=A0A848J2G7_9BACT|nr:hypothetical protein [Marinigracilibium pacificum]NMM49518.1 hypothetical protein [Marinigracilibium pacificum]
MRYLIIIIIMSGVVSSCSDASKEKSADLTAERDSLYQNVMHIHDELMAPATTLNLMRNKAEKMMDSISVSGDTASVFYKDLSQAHSNILVAQKEMREWMMNFKRKGVSKDEVTEYDAMVDTMAIDYLEGEFDKLQELKKTTEKALMADSLIKK